MENFLGLLYVTCWSISAYPIVWTNWKAGNPNAVSFDYIVLNTIGYGCLLTSMILLTALWSSESSENVERPILSTADFVYCCHSLVMNFLMLSQYLCGTSIWGFDSELRITYKMRSIYGKVAMLSLFIIFVLTALFANLSMSGNLTNSMLLSYCNKLSLVKIFMSLIKYFPQVRHNYERKSMKGFPIQSTLIDILGSICSLGQLALRLASRPEGLTIISLISNFSKIGIGLICLLFNFIFISQWISYR